jgi:hypothetical protein
MATAPAHAAYSRTGAYAWGGVRPADQNTVFSWEGVVRDEATGLPKVLYDGVPYWNTVTLSLYGLQEFNRFAVHGRRASLRRAAKVGDWLVHNQPRDGAWRYRMSFSYPRLGMISPPWVAAQAQGNAISLLVRLYAATERRGYLRSALKARRPFQRPLGRTGVSRFFQGRMFFEGFPTAQPSLTLEDFQLAILGLYDLAPYDDAARRLWRRGMGSLVWALPLYEDAKQLPQWDLAHRTAGAAPLYSQEAHLFNAKLLRLLARLSGSRTGREVAARWLGTHTAARSRDFWSRSAAN